MLRNGLAARAGHAHGVEEQHGRAGRIPQRFKQHGKTPHDQKWRLESSNHRALKNCLTAVETDVCERLYCSTGPGRNQSATPVS